MPPVHSGMTPSLLPARSAPTGVSGVPVRPSLATSSGGALACTPTANTAQATRTASLLCWNRNMSSLPVDASERIFGRELDEIAVADQIEVAGAEIIRVGEIEHPTVDVGGFGANGDGFAAANEVSARPRRDAAHVVAEGNARREVERRAEHVVVIPARGDAVTPRELGRETVGLRDRVAQVAGGDICATTGIGAVAIETQSARQVPDLVESDFADQGDLARAEQVVRPEDLRSGQLPLPPPVPLPALDFLPGSELSELADETPGGLRNHPVEWREAGEQQLDAMQLQRHVRPVAQLALQGDAAGFEQGIEAHRKQADILRIFDEIAAGDRQHARRRRRDRDTAHQRQLAVVVDRVEAELGVVQPVGHVAQRTAKLTVLARIPVAAARERGRAAGLHQRWRQAGVAVLVIAPVADVVVAVGIDHRLRHGAEIEHDVTAADGGVVVRREEAADRIRVGLLVLELV